MSTEFITRLYGLHVDGKLHSGLHVWLQSCNLQTLQPTVSWFQVQDIFAKTYAALEETQHMSREEKLALFQLFGGPFMVKYLPNIQVEPYTSEPSAQILQDMHTRLRQQLQVAANEIGFHSVFSCNTSSEKTSDEIQILRRHIATMAQNNLDLFLLKDQQERKKIKNSNVNSHANSLLGMANGVSKCQSKYEWKGNRKSPEHIACVKQVQYNENINRELCSRQSEAIGEIVSSILLKHPRKTTPVTSALSGYRLPTSLRRHLWKEVLFQSQKHLLKKGNIEQLVRLEFGQIIQQNCQELKIKNATKSPINCLIENAVIETYSKIPSLNKFGTDTHLKEASRVLNVLYVYDRTYQPCLIYWLLALQITFPINTKDPVQIGEHVCELAMYLTLVRTSCFPYQLHVLTIAKQVLDILKEHDPVLHAHLHQIAAVNVQNDTKEVLTKNYMVNKKKTEIVSSDLKHLNSSELQHFLSFSMEHLAPSDPVFYIYKWIREGFVSVLDTAAMWWLWDQCFLQNWNPKVLCDVSVALIFLLRPYFMDANDNPQMEKVFLNDPQQLFTKDIQKAWIHIQNQRPLVEVPKINRQHFQLCQRADIHTSDPFSILENITCSKSMTSFILEDVHLKLEFLPSVLQESNGKVFQIPWSKSPNMDNIVINVRSQFCQTTVAAKHVTGPHSKLKTKVDVAGRLTTVLSVDSRFKFQFYDAVQYKSEIKQGGYPYVIISVHYTEGINIVPLGWASITLVELDAWNSQKWIGINQQETFFPLHPGDIPVELGVSETYIPVDQINLSKYLLGYNSEIFLTLTVDGQGTTECGHERNICESRNENVEKSQQMENWVKHIPPDELINLEPKATNKDTFDIYIDCVRFIPDSASIIKVTVSLLQKKYKDLSQKGSFLPNLDGPAQSPTFSAISSRLVVNIDKLALSPESLLLVTLYTVEMLSGQLTTIGFCLMSLYYKDNKKKVLLRVGGHQLCVQNGNVAIGQGKKPSISTLVSFPKIPAASVLVRILPHSVNAIPAPSYSSGYYKSEDCKPNSSEERILQSYKEQNCYPFTVSDMIWKLQTLLQIPTEERKEEMQAWYEKQMDSDQMKSPDSVLNILQCVWYRNKIGLQVKVERAFLLQYEDMYVQCFGQVFPGKKSDILQDEKENKFVTLKHDYDSQLHSPVWQDEAKLLHPIYNENTCLVLQLVGIRVAYHPSIDHNQPGIICSPDGTDIQFNEDAVIAWTAFNLFDKYAVQMGYHHLPLVSGRPSLETLQQLSTESSSSVLLSVLQNKKSNSSLLVSLWDGHFHLEDVPSMPLHEDMLKFNVSGKSDLKSRLQSNHGNAKSRRGKKISDLVLENFEKKIRLKGTNSTIYEKEQKFFEKVVTNKFYNLIESFLLTAGSGSL